MLILKYNITMKILERITPNGTEIQLKIEQRSATTMLTIEAKGIEISNTGNSDIYINDEMALPLVIK